MKFLALLIIFFGTATVYQNTSIGFFPSLLFGGFGSCFLLGAAWQFLKDGVASAGNPKINLKSGRSGNVEVNRKGQLDLTGYNARDLIEGAIHLRKIKTISPDTLNRMLTEIHASNLNVVPVSPEEGEAFSKSVSGKFGRKSEMHFAVASEAGLLTHEERAEIERFIERQYSSEKDEDDILEIMAEAARGMKAR